MSTPVEITPNVVIRNPDTRRRIGVLLWSLLLAAAILSLFFQFFPELAFGTDVPGRAIAFVNSAVSILAAGFGLVVSTPNVPRSDGASLLRRDYR